MKNLAFLMSSCDGYDDLWEPFFECLDLMWKDIDIPVYLNTEHKVFTPKKELGFQVRTLNQKSKKTLSWSRRFIEALERIQEEYIFLVLDDFFVCDKVDADKMAQIVSIMEEDPAIASFQLYGTRIRNKNPEAYVQGETLRYTLMGKQGWKTHFVPTVWRKSTLLKWLRPWESIWAFEECGSQRARRWNYPEKVYVVENAPIYDYLWIKDCSAVINGKWLAEKELLTFFEENQIQVDWSRRGKMTYDEYMAITMKDVVRKYTPLQILVKCVNRIRSFF